MRTVGTRGRAVICAGAARAGRSGGRGRGRGGGITRIRPERHRLPHRIPRRMRPQPREAPHRPGPGTLPALARRPPKPPRLGTAAPARITAPGTATITASPRTRSRRPLAYPITGLPNTYDAFTKWGQIRKCGPRYGFSAMPHQIEEPPGEDAGAVSVSGCQ